MKRTFQGRSKITRLRVHGFRARRQTVGGRRVLNNRRSKGRERIGVTVSIKYRSA